MTSLTGDTVAAERATAVLISPQALVRRTRQRDVRPLVCGLALLGADVLAALAATALAVAGMAFALHGSRMSGHVPVAAMPLDLAALLAAVVIHLALQGRYAERIPFWTETRLVVCASLVAAAAEAGFLLLTGHALEDSWAVSAFPAFAVLAIAANRLAKHILSQGGLWRLPVVVVGDGPAAQEAEAAVGSDRSLGYAFVGRVDPASVMADPGRMRLRAVLNRHRADKLLIAIGVDGHLQRQVIECALRERVPFAMVPPPHAFPAFGWASTPLFSCDATLLSFRDGLSRPMSRIVKAAIDVLAALVLLVLASPLFLVIVAAVCLDGGPAFYAHQRVGTGGRPFRCLKFRTMVVDGEHVLQELLANDAACAAEWAAMRKLARDPRVTRVGRFLRRTSLDELPQLFNVLRLEMSLVGPRPIVESEIPFYGEHIAHYYAARPGMTGLWQVSGRSNTSYARRVQLDVWYVNNWSIWNDIAVLLKTIPAVLGRVGAH